ncbi:gliding motility-associated C-terminal domain-containing protein [Flavisolibacter nicotianae]|uniref:gliding motility-associated C-terminal domain-containing protein n=1 Tax=Flavisolibacter nicotianae TaxID=2364882 RepID=UPI000EAD1959|nr:gliding motility-associated C-terminal domain-containing protein [Flavisolibacter nicotianae]
MIRPLFILLLSALATAASAQNPATVISTARDITVPCTTTCTTLTATVPDIRQSDDYIVQTIPYNPFAYAAGGNELVPLYADDIYSSALPLPFPVCFYGATYNSLVVGSNGIVSFDLTNAGKRNNFRQTTSPISTTPVPIPYAGGTQNSLASTYYPKASIMGVFHDIFPVNNGLRRIEWRIEGQAPMRRFIASFKDVPMYSCTSLMATHQLVIYESTGVVEVYVQDKPVCSAWNSGLATLGMQNFARNKAVFPAGKNASRWGSMGMNEAYRFLPTAGTSKFQKAELLLHDNVISLADTVSGAPGELNLSFANVCPTDDSTQYILRVTYQSCTSPQDVTFEDTLTVRKEKLDLRLQVEDPTCTSSGTIKADATGTSVSFLYSLNGEPAQTANVFNGLKAGDYVVTATSATCTCTATATLVLQDDLSLTTQPTATICAGDVFLPQVSSNGTSFTWSPVQGVSNSTEKAPQITTTASTVYTLTATRGICQKSASVALTVKPLPVVNAGQDQTIVQGDAVTLAATASAGTYVWTPATGLNDASSLTPTVRPASTTIYTVHVTADGCTASDDVTIDVAPYCVRPMEAFTPNGDGVNDRWLVTNGDCLKKAKVEIFNRYGGKIYQSDNYKNNWDGTYGGKPVADGTYYFIITYQLINGQSVVRKGNVTILR